MSNEINIFDATTLPTGPDLPSLATFIAHVRAFLPKLTLSINPDGIWIRSTTAVVSAQCFFAALDYFAEFRLSPHHPVIEIPILTHELDAVLSSFISGAEAASHAMIRLQVRAADLAHLHVSTSSTATGTLERAIVRVCKPHPPYASGEWLPPALLPLPRLLSAEIYPVGPDVPTLLSTRNTVSPKVMIRTLRAHKAQRVNITLHSGGRLLVASEYGGNARQSELGGWGAARESSAPEIADGPRVYLSGLILALLKTLARVDASRFRIDRECGPGTPLQLLTTLGHVSYIRFFVADSSFTFDTSPPNPNPSSPEAQS